MGREEGKDEWEIKKRRKERISGRAGKGERGKSESVTYRESSNPPTPYGKDEEKRLVGKLEASLLAPERLLGLAEYQSDDHSFSFAFSIRNGGVG